MEQVLCKGYIAAADYSSTGQYRFVKLTSANTITLCGAGERPIGILQNNPEAGEIGNVMLYGISKLYASAAIALMAAVGIAADGEGVTTTTDTDEYGGLCVEAGTAADDVIQILLTPGAMFAG